MQHCEVRTFHVGVIMDGNGRWAELRGLNRITGHRRGARRVTEIVDACPRLGVTHLTLFAFSTENWQRPMAEIDGLMLIFRQYIRRKMDGLKAHDVRVRFIGMRHRVPDRLQALMHELERRTQTCRGLNLTIAIDYGSRDEMTRALRAVVEEATRDGLAPRAISPQMIAGALDTHELPDPDFIIRTSGECRVSNFLLWQSAYAEYAFPSTTWPDFSAMHFEEAVEGFHDRARRFGTLEAFPSARIAGGFRT